MAKISINLLPGEVVDKENQQKKFNRIQLIGIAVILLMVLLSSLTVAFRILQSSKLSRVQEELTNLTQRITDLKETQESLFMIKNRIDVINKNLGASSKQTMLYNLVERLTPKNLTINALTVGRSGDVVILATAQDTVALDSFISNLSTSDSNEGKISQVSVENLSRGRDGFYRISFKLLSR